MTGRELRLMYLVGPPGAGKSTLMAALVAGKRRRVHDQPFAHTKYEDGLVQLGRERAAHGGTDVLSMSVAPRAKAALDAHLWSRIIGEGDRLATASFFEAANAAGYLLDVVLLDCDGELAAARRAERGSAQDESWVKGRLTKVERLRPYATLTLDASRPIESLVAELRQLPIFQET